MRYMMFIKCSEDYRKETVPASLMEAMGQLVVESMKRGDLIDTAGLLPSKDGLRVSLRHGKISTTDGPFTETKELVGGYAIVEAKSKEEARVFARDFMELHRKHWPTFEGECEVRPLEIFEGPPPTV
jgi:hypothetical protein